MFYCFLYFQEFTSAYKTYIYKYFNFTNKFNFFEMSQKSLKERAQNPSLKNINPEIINEIGYNENLFNKEILNQDHIDNYSIATPDVGKRIEIDIRDLGKMKVTENKTSLENKDTASKSKN